MQTKMGSFVESWTNVVIGFSINYVANLLIFPWFGFHIGLGANFFMGVIYTAISLTRSFLIRRKFNGMKFGNKPETYDYEALRIRALSADAYGKLEDWGVLSITDQNGVVHESRFRPSGNTGGYEP